MVSARVPVTVMCIGSSPKSSRGPGGFSRPLDQDVRGLEIITGDSLCDSEQASKQRDSGSQKEDR